MWFLWSACPFCLDVWIAVSDLSTPGFLFQRHAWLMDRGRVSARLPTYFLWPESRQRASPCYPRPCASLRAACAVKLLELCGKTHFELRSSFKHVAASQSTKLLHSAVQQLAQALAVAGLPGAKRRDADSRDVFFYLLCLHAQEKKVASRGDSRPLSVATKRCCFDSCLRLIYKR